MFEEGDERVAFLATRGNRTRSLLSTLHKRPRLYRERRENPDRDAVHAGIERSEKLGVMTVWRKLAPELVRIGTQHGVGTVFPLSADQIRLREIFEMVEHGQAIERPCRSPRCRCRVDARRST